MTPRPLFVAATVSYLANCALGGAVAARVIDTRRIRWVHHAVYVSTAVLAGAAVSSLLWHRGDNRAALALVPAAAPLAAIPRVSARTRGHVGIALSAAPFFVTSLILSCSRR